MASVWGELKRRNVVRVAIAYVFIAWLILQVGDTLAPALHLGEWVNTALAFFLILGLPIALIFAWAYELTPEGLKKEKEVDRSQSISHITGRKFDYAIIAVLVLALGYFVFDKFVLKSVAGRRTETIHDCRRNREGSRGLLIIPLPSCPFATVAQTRKMPNSSRMAYTTSY